MPCRDIMTRSPDLDSIHPISNQYIRRYPPHTPPNGMVIPAIRITSLLTAIRFPSQYNTIQYTTIQYLRLRTESDLGLLYVMRQLQFTAEHENKLVVKVRWRFCLIPFGINLELFWMPFGNPSPPGEAKRPQDVAQGPLFSN